MIELRKEIKKPKVLIRPATSQELLEYKSYMIAKRLEAALAKRSINIVKTQNK